MKDSIPPIVSNKIVEPCRAVIGLCCKLARWLSASVPTTMIMHQGLRDVAVEVSTSHQQEHGSHPLQRLARGHPRLLLGHLGSTSSNSSCGSAEYPGEAIPHHPGLAKADPGNWWASFFFRKPTLSFMATMLEPPEHWESPQASSGMTTCDLIQASPAKSTEGPVLSNYYQPLGSPEPFLPAVP